MAFQDSHWRFERDRDWPKGPMEDQTIIITETSREGGGGIFTAHYDLLSNQSVFTGEIWTRETEVLSLKQHDQKTKYVAFHIAHKKDNKYEGRWVDNAGNQGTFRLTRLPHP